MNTDRFDTMPPGAVGIDRPIDQIVAPAIDDGVARVGAKKGELDQVRGVPSIFDNGIV